LIAIAGFALSVATSAQALTPAPICQPRELMIEAVVGSKYRSHGARERIVCERRRTHLLRKRARLRSCQFVDLKLS
jgi:hypothetical protein